MIELLASLAIAGTLIVGTPGNDVIYGTPGDDVIYGYQGHDLIIGLEGNDVIYPGLGANTVYAGPGDDMIWTRSQAPRRAERVYCGTGYDVHVDRGSALTFLFFCEVAR